MPKDLLTQIYYAQFYSHISFGCQLWGQKLDEHSKTFLFQKKSVGLLDFKHFQAPSSPIFKDKKLLKLMGIIQLKNTLFVHNVLNKKAPKHFHNFVITKTSCHNHNTINNPNSIYSIPTGSVDLPNMNGKHGESSVKYRCAQSWNEMLKFLGVELLKDMQIILIGCKICPYMFSKNLLLHIFCQHTKVIILLHMLHGGNPHLFWRFILFYVLLWDYYGY